MKFSTDSDIPKSPTIPERDLRVIEVLTPLLATLSNGVVRPNDISYQIKKLELLEKDLNISLEDLKKCCPTDSVTREAKDFKYLISLIIRRIERILS